MSEKTMLIIAIVWILIGLVIYFAWQIKKHGLRATVVKLIVYAEKTYLKGQNNTKLNYVIDYVINILPVPLKIFITRDMIKEFVQKIFDEVKEALDYTSGGQV